MKAFASVLLIALQGCSTVQDFIPNRNETPEQTAARERARVERETTERFAVCMDRTIGKFGAFAAPETRRKAAETCGEVAKATPASN